MSNAVIAAQTELIATLTAKVEAFEGLVLRQGELLGRNSGNSNLPPSSDGPAGAGGAKPRTKRTSDRKRGGQRKHKGSHRALVAAEHVDEFIDTRRAARRATRGCRRRQTRGRGVTSTPSSPPSRRASSSIGATK